MILLYRQAADARDEDAGFSLGEQDLLDWMEANGKKPGDRMTEFFYGEAR